MPRNPWVSLVKVVSLAATLFSSFSILYGEETDDLPAQAGAILSRYCARCHRGEGSESGYAFNVTNVGSLTDHSVVVAGDPSSSDLYEAIFKGRMPPRNQSTLPKPTPEETKIIERWIAAGAPAFPKPMPRDTVSLKSVVRTIKTHFETLDAKQRANTRYFTLTHLYNDPTVDERHLRMVRAGLAKGLNSLSWEKALVQPTAIDEAKTIYAVDIAALGWTRDHWNTLVAEYPYGLGFASHDDRELGRLDDELRRLAGNSQLLHLRADWFVTIGLKPKLYHKLLYDLVLPDLKKRADDPKNPNNPKHMTDLDLENFLKVDVAANIYAEPPKARRSGFNFSGISGQNRMIERHPKKVGAYWKSYDFLASNRKSLLSEFPLGPAHKTNPFDGLAFKHDGGEIIFTLPNGLQGYLLATAEGVRIDAGPIEIVGDSLKTSGNQQIVTGLSCIACHRKGMIEPPDDEIRQYATAFTDARERVEQLYPENDEMRKLIDGDRMAFLQVNDALVRGYLIAGDDRSAHLENLPEPVGEVARRFLHEPMTIETVAAELYEIDLAALAVKIKSDNVLNEMGLKILTRDGGSIKRDAWESKLFFTQMQEMARQFGYTPRR